VITYLEKVKKTIQQQLGERSENLGETTMQIPRSGKKEGEEVLQETQQRFPCSPW